MEPESSDKSLNSLNADPEAASNPDAHEVPTPQDRQLNDQSNNNQINININIEKSDASGGEQISEGLEENLDIKSHKIRYGLLAILFSSGLLILGRSLIDGNLGKPTPFNFPAQIDFAPPSMKLAQAKPPEPIIDEKSFFGRSKYLFGEKYSYVIDNTPIDIELRYLVGTEGDLVPFVKELGNIDIKDEQLRAKSIRRDPIGFHAFLSSPNRAYLTSCINPRGIATVTREQFDDNGSNQATNKDVIIGWLLGQQDLRDRRCLWTLISTPISSESDREVANQKLEKIWISWYEWWKPRFPPL